MMFVVNYIESATALSDIIYLTINRAAYHVISAHLLDIWGKFYEILTGNPN